MEVFVQTSFQKHPAFLHFCLGELSSYLTEVGAKGVIVGCRVFFARQYVHELTFKGCVSHDIVYISKDMPTYF